MLLLSSNTRVFLLCLLFPILLLQGVEAEHCLICDSEEVRYPFAVIMADGTTCAQLQTSLVEYADDSSLCTKPVQAWRETCCNGDTEPADVEVT